MPYLLATPADTSNHAALGALGICDPQPDGCLDCITRLAARLFDVPIARIGPALANLLWLAPTGAPPGAAGEPLVIPDTLADPRFAGHPLLAGAPPIRFYAGVPLHSRDGAPLGTLCLVDWRPHELRPGDLSALRDLAACAVQALQAGRLQDTLGLSNLGEERYRSAVAVLHEGIVIQDSAGAILAANVSAERILGLNADQLAGRTSRDPRWRSIREDGTTFPSDEHPAMVTLRTGEPCTNVVMGVHKPGGELTWLVINSQPLFHDGVAGPSAVVVSFLDITEHKRAEHDLRESEERYRSLVESAQDVIFTLAPDHTITSINSAFESSLGWPRAASIGRSFEPLVAEEDLPRALAMMGRALAGEPGKTLEAFELRIRTLDGGFRHSEFTITPQTKDGQVIGVLGIARDISERRQSEAALLASEARNRALVDAIPDLMFRLSGAGEYRDFKAEQPGDLAVAPEQLIGTTIYDALPTAVAQRIQHAIDQALRTGATQTVEYGLVLDGAPRDFEARIVVCGHNEVLSIVRDITERKHVERMKNEFIAVVSHELRTPLTAIIGSLGLVAGNVAGLLTPKASALIDIALKNGQRLSRLVNDFLDIEKIEAGRMVFDLKPATLGGLVEQVIEANRPYGSEFGVAFELMDMAAGAVVEVDADRLTQALTNLLSNAVKFSPADGVVSVAVLYAGSGVRINVVDCGPGIPEAFRARLFDKFAQADSSDARRRGGTGLGLSITKAIVEKLGGAIGYAVDAERGTTFYLDLPLWRGISSEHDHDCCHAQTHIDG